MLCYSIREILFSIVCFVSTNLPYPHTTHTNTQHIPRHISFWRKSNIHSASLVYSYYFFMFFILFFFCFRIFHLSNGAHAFFIAVIRSSCVLFAVSHISGNRKMINLHRREWEKEREGRRVKREIAIANCFSLCCSASVCLLRIRCGYLRIDVCSPNRKIYSHGYNRPFDRK